MLGIRDKPKLGRAPAKTCRINSVRQSLLTCFCQNFQNASRESVAKGTCERRAHQNKFPIGFEQCSNDLTCLCNLCMLSHTSPNCNLHYFLYNVTYMSVEVISGMLAPGKCNLTFSTSCQEHVRLHFPGTPTYGKCKLQ